MKPKDIGKLIASLVLAGLMAAVGGAVTESAIRSGWYALLVKPALMPPDAVFGPVWGALYFLIGISLFLVWRNNWKIKNQVLTHKHKSWNNLFERLWNGNLQTLNVVLVFGMQVVLNVLWTFLFFGLRRPDIAFFEILALWFAIFYTIVNFYRISKAAGYLLVPYIFWVSFAMYLNFGIWIFN